MEIAKITARGQMTIPKKVRDAAHLVAGDRVALYFAGGCISLSKITSTENDYLKTIEATLGEWSSPEDDEAWRDL
jgi:AbrB family looped-hinge helix DNA binding protein